MSAIYQIFGTKGQHLAYNLLAALDLDLAPGMKVGIKPNLVLAKESKQGATTDPEVVAGIIEYLQRQNIDKITIMEGAWVGSDTEQAFQICGYQKLAKEYDVELYNLKQDSTRNYKRESLEIEVCRTPLEVDFLINVPVLKAHCQTKMTCALKNLKGCLPDSEKRKFHTLGLHQPIACLNTILISDLTVVDGIIGDLTFEEGGNPVAMNRVLAGYDPVAIDSYVAQLMGLETAEVDYIKLAENLEVGKSNLESITVQSLNQPQQAAKIRKNLAANQVEELKNKIKECQACSACVGSLVHALQRIKEKGELPKEQIYIGQGWEEELKSGIGIGSCNSNLPISVAGCPPNARKIVEKLSEL